MKTAILVVLFMAGVGVGFGLSMKITQPKYHLVPPEEWKALSTNPKQPDTVTAWLDKDTIRMDYIPGHYVTFLSIREYVPRHGRYTLYDVSYLQHGKTMSLSRLLWHELDSLNRDTFCLTKSPL